MGLHPRFDIKREILLPVARRLRERADSLREMNRFRASGIEGWLKVEVVAALGAKVRKLQNKGPDVILEHGIEIELKAATDFYPTGIRQGALKYHALCLFLADGSQPSRISDLVDESIELVGYEVFSDGESEWIIGVISPTH